MNTLTCPKCFSHLRFRDEQAGRCRKCGTPIPLLVAEREPTPEDIKLVLGSRSLTDKGRVLRTCPPQSRSQPGYVLYEKALVLVRGTGEDRVLKVLDFSGITGPIVLADQSEQDAEKDRWVRPVIILRYEDSREKVRLPSNSWLAMIYRLTYPGEPTCWYCWHRKGAPHTLYARKRLSSESLTGEGGVVLRSAGTSRTVLHVEETRYDYKRILVPRCEECEKCHRRGALANVFEELFLELPIGFIVFVLFCWLGLWLLGAKAGAGLFIPILAAAAAFLPLGVVAAFMRHRYLAGRIPLLKVEWAPAMQSLTKDGYKPTTESPEKLQRKNAWTRRLFGYKVPALRSRG